ncbi:DUF6037 family protein [Bifidobacterium tsurumiense]|nr:DUF6037 family protein [Bifidobacterium tsurumiense]
MDLPTLTMVSRMIWEQHDHETRFRWRTVCRGVEFEAFYDGEPNRRDERGRYGELIVTQVNVLVIDPVTGKRQKPWSHTYRVRKNRTTGMLFSYSNLGDDYEDLRSLLRIGYDKHGTWHVGDFLSLIERGVQRVPGEWGRCRIATAADIPSSHRADIEEADKIRFVGFRDNRRRHEMQSPANRDKTIRLCGNVVQRFCERNGLSTRWTSGTPNNIPCTWEECEKETVTHF